MGILNARERDDLRHDAGTILAEGPDAGDDGVPSVEYSIAEGVVRALDSLEAVERERDEYFGRLVHRERDLAERAADRATEGDTGICRTCALPITYETVEEPGYKPRTGWSDGARRDALVCFSAINYRHAPLIGRELALWNAATKAALKEVDRA